MLVCHCRRVSDREIKAHLKSGAGTVRGVCKMSGAGTGCGGCMPVVKELVREHSDDAPRPSALGSRTAATGVYR
jgi:bacterioferritin-associated ferredoxin